MSLSGNFGDYQFGIYMQGMFGVKPDRSFRFEEVERLAREKLPPEAYWYVAGSAGDMSTCRANLRAFDRWQIVPRMLRDVSVRKHAVEILGTKMPAPLMLAPIGVQEIVHPEGEIAVARAARELGVPMILSTAASNSLEDVATALGDTPRWFQLYWMKDKEMVQSVITRAAAAGYSALVITLDTKMMGWRARDLEAGYLPFLKGQGIANYTSDPVFRSRLEETPEENPQAAVLHWAQIFSDSSHTWDDLKFILDNTKLPVVLKGIQHVEDASLAAQAGVAGIIVSNHGGRQVDGAIGALHTLPGIVDAVGDKLCIGFDSGIRHGADIVKALALGAKFCCLGRPYSYGLAIGGEEGVKDVVQRILSDYDLTMSLAGYTEPGQLNREMLVEGLG